MVLKLLLFQVIFAHPVLFVISVKKLAKVICFLVLRENLELPTLAKSVSSVATK